MRKLTTILCGFMLLAFVASPPTQRVKTGSPIIEKDVGVKTSLMNVSFEMIALPQSPVLVEPGLAQHQTAQLLSMRLPKYSFGLKTDERRYRWCTS